MKNIIIIIAICTLFCSCKSKNDNYIIEFKKDITFNVGFQAGESFSGTFYNNNEPHYYFSEVVSRKVVKIFDKNANLVKEISLKNQEYLNLARNLYMPSMDSIIITIGDPVQKVLVTNSKGETLFEKYFEQYIRTDSIDYALDAPLWLPAARYNNNIYLINGAFKQLQYNATPDQYALMRSIVNRQPRICQVSLDTNINPIYFGNNTLSKIYDNDTVNVGNPPFFTIGNHYLFDIARHSGKIAVFDLTTNKLCKILEIKHNNKIIGERKSNNKDVICKELSIDNIVWDKYRELYYVLLSRGVKNKYQVIIQIFDKNFHFKQEVEMKDRLSTLTVLVSKEGISLRLISNDKNVTYKLYSINKI